MGTRIHNSGLSRPTDDERNAEAQRKQEAAAQMVNDRQTERDELALKLVGIAESMRKDENLDCRRMHRVEVDFHEQGQAVVVVHSHVFPTYQHNVPKQAIEAMLADQTAITPQKGK